MVNAMEEREKARKRIDRACELIIFVCEDFRDGFITPDELEKMLASPEKDLHASIALFDKFSEIAWKEVCNA